MAEQSFSDETYDEQAPAAPRRTWRQTPLGRLGCGLLLVLWFTFLLTPCFLITMATQGQITISLGGLPDQQLRAWLIMEMRERGFGISVPTVIEQSETAAVMQVDNRFLLWAGRADPVSFCNRFERADANSAWQLADSEMGACSVPGA
ncbi:MAG: hypothetical protein HC828_19460 [Blastochloris sp.]|nr:hypothetical protein [Blastochloris sp.]